MPRLPRIDFPGLFHHVIARGIERRRIFRRDSDYADFVGRLGRVLSETQTVCYTWALMPNHIHLLLQTGVTRIARMMQRLLTGYAVSFNLRYGRAGHLFQNRYKDILCQKDPYFLELVRYIGLNPARAGLVHTPEELAVYPWTGHAVLMGKMDRPWQSVGPVLEQFGDPLSSRAAYESYVIEAWNQKKHDRFEGGGLIRSCGGASEALRAVRQGDVYAYDQRILGDSAFVEETLKRADQQSEEARSLQTVKIETLLDVVADLTGEETQRLGERGQNRALTSAKAMAVYAGVAWLKQSTAAMGRCLALSPSAASRAFERGRLLAEEIQLADRLKAQSIEWLS